MWLPVIIARKSDIEETTLEQFELNKEIVLAVTCLQIFKDVWILHLVYSAPNTSNAFAEILKTLLAFFVRVLSV